MNGTVAALLVATFPPIRVAFLAAFPEAHPSPSRRGLTLALYRPSVLTRPG
jgi:hypothetical protein